MGLRGFLRNSNRIKYIYIFIYYIVASLLPAFFSMLVGRKAHRRGKQVTSCRAMLLYDAASSGVTVCHVMECHLSSCHATSVESSCSQHRHAIAQSHCLLEDSRSLHINQVPSKLEGQKSSLDLNRQFADVIFGVLSSFIVYLCHVPMPFCRPTPSVLQNIKIIYSIFVLHIRPIHPHGRQLL